MCLYNNEHIRLRVLSKPWCHLMFDCWGTSRYLNQIDEEKQTNTQSIQFNSVWRVNKIRQCNFHALPRNAKFTHYLSESLIKTNKVDVPRIDVNVQIFCAVIVNLPWSFRFRFVSFHFSYVRGVVTGAFDFFYWAFFCEFIAIYAYQKFVWSLIVTVNMLQCCLTIHISLHFSRWKRHTRAHQQRVHLFGSRSVFLFLSLCLHVFRQ